MRAAVARDARALERLFTRHARRMHRLATHLLGRDDETADLVQDAFLEAIEHLPTLSEPQAFERWLNVIVVRSAARFIKRKRLLRRLGLDRGTVTPLESAVDHLIAPGAPAEATVQLRRIYAALESMPTALRVTLVLRRVEGYDLQQIARLTDTSLSTVKRRIVDADARLAKATRGSRQGTS